MRLRLITFSLLLATTAAAQDAPKFDSSTSFVLTVPPLLNCWFYQTRVNQPPLVDWKCAEKIAAQDGYDPAKEIADALLAIRDHRYEEKQP
jgi:hypothetical protein